MQGNGITGATPAYPLFLLHWGTSSGQRPATSATIRAKPVTLPARVTRWQGGIMILRWTAAGVLEAALASLLDIALNTKQFHALKVIHSGT